MGRSKKARFLFTGTRETRDLQSLVFAITPGGIVRQNFANPKRSTEFSASISRQIGDGQTLTVRYEPSRDNAKGDGVGGFTLPEAGYDARAREDEVFIDHTASLTPRLVNQLRVRLGREVITDTSRVAGAPHIVVQDAFTGGGAQADHYQTENRILFDDVFSWTHRRHLFKAGVSVPGFRRWALTDRTNRDGTFSFSSLASYAAGRPIVFEAQRGDPSLVFWQKDFGLFVQDEFTWRPNLTLSAGLRYDRQNYLPDRDNLAPRLSIAFAPGKNRRTVLRAGAGIFYDRTGEGAIADRLRLDGRRLLQYVLTDPGYPDPLAGGGTLAATPPSITRFAGDLRSPYVVRYSAGVERQLRGKLALTIGYTGIAVVGLFRSRDINAPLAPGVGRPDPGIGVLRSIESAGRLESSSLDVGLRGSIADFFDGQLQYALGRAYNNTGGIGWFPADSYDLSGEWARTNFDVRQRFRAIGTFHAGDLFDQGVILSLNTGAPYTITTGQDNNGDGRVTDRPPGTPRNSMQGFEAANLDFRLSREFKLGRGKEGAPTVEAGLEAFNVFNRVNYTNVVGNLSSPFFGQPVAARPARRLQLRVGFQF